MSADFWLALAEAPSFWKSIAPPTIAIALVVGLAGFCLLRRSPLLPLIRLRQDTRGAAAILDLVLVTPVFTVIMVTFLQWSVLLNDSIVVHYAAFAAARSARVHVCPIFPTDLAEVVELLHCEQAKEFYTRAARYALIPAGPFNSRYGCEGACRAPEDTLYALARGLQIEPQTDAWLTQARYTFDPANTEITVSTPLIAEGMKLFGDMRELPVTATVKYRHVLFPMMDKVFGDGYRSDGTGYVIIVAEMTLI